MTQELFEKWKNEGTVILEGFTSTKDVFEQFDIEPNPNIQILFAYYECGNYEGDATVFYFDKTTNLYYETYGGHCSCYGLEGQWSPEEIMFKELDNRVMNGSFAGLYYFKGLLGLS